MILPLLLLLGLLGPGVLAQSNSTNGTRYYYDFENHFRDNYHYFLGIPTLDDIQQMFKILRMANEASHSTEVKDVLDAIEEDICGTQDCGKNYIYDCHCQNSFLRYNSGVEECSNLICNLFRTFREDIPATVDKMIEADSYVKLVKASLPLVEKLMGQICTCKTDLTTAIQGCLTGQTFTHALGGYTTKALKRLYWGPIKRIWKRMSKPLCDEECGIDQTLHLIRLARILDDSNEESGSCSDISGLVEDVEETSDRRDYYPPKTVDYLYRIKYYGQQAGELFWCGKKSCRRERQKKFSTCCYGNLLKAVNGRAFLKDVKKLLLDELRGHYEEEELERADWMFGNSVDALLRALDPDQSRCSRLERECELE